MGIQLELEPGAFGLIAPFLIIGGLAFFVLLWDTLVKPRDKNVLLGISLAGIGFAAIVSMVQWGQVGDAANIIFSGRLTVDRFSLFFNVLFLLVAALVLLVSRDYLEREDIHVGEYYALILFSVFGMMILGMASDLLMLFIGVEVMSIPIYVLVAFNRSHYRSIEGALKYFILGAFATSFLLYGIALLYGQAHTTNLAEINMFLQRPSSNNFMVPLAIGLLLIGFGFKVASVPFHMWTPDAYEGAATPVTATMATGVKAAAFAAIIRTFLALSPAMMVHEKIILVIAALTIVVGNIAAIRQTNLKRMLAYSSIAHSGYMFAALLAIRPSGGILTSNAMGALLFYLLAYVFMNIGAFAIIIIVGRREEEALQVEDWAGLGFKHPWLGAAMTLFMLSLGGLPPTAGFMAKFYLFSAVLDAGHTGLVVLAVLMSAASFYYYLRVVVYMYMHPGTEKLSPKLSILALVAVGVASFATIWMGIAPTHPISILQWARESVTTLL